MRVLLVGSGAREHALAWALSRSPDLRLTLLPGNPGMRPLGDTIEGIAIDDVGAVAAVAAAQRIDLVVIGPEAPLAAGVADVLARTGIPVFGPTRAAARLESSKAFAKDVMRRAGVPTASAEVFSDPAGANSHLDGSTGPYVVKADGLAAGKGVLVTESREEAKAWVAHCFDGGFGTAGSQVVIEEYLDGPELSVFAVCDGERYLTLEPARDYKRLADDDQGPNTGGMGSYSPVEVPSGLVDEVGRTVIAPTLQTMAADGHPYVGFLYVGLALTSSGARVIEFNCRLGDPETQVVLPRLETELMPMLASAAAGELDTEELRWTDDAVVNVVLVADGYPSSPRSGDTISGLDSIPDNVLIFHAGTETADRRLVTSGGRVLSVVGRGSDLAAARTAAYDAIDGISFAGMRYRTDIAKS